MIKLPKSNSLISTNNFTDVLRSETRNLSNISPLALRGEITTWQYDAKNCISLFYRIFRINIYSRRLFEAINQWALRLILYSYELGFEPNGYPIHLITGNQNIHEGYWWAVQELRRISKIKWSDIEYHDLRVWQKIPAIIIEDQTKICGLLHCDITSFNYAIQYYSVKKSTHEKVLSEWVGNISLKKMTNKINQAVRKHRNPEYREHIIKGMREKRYDRIKLRSFGEL